MYWNFKGQCGLLPNYIKKLFIYIANLTMLNRRLVLLIELCNASHVVIHNLVWTMVLHSNPLTICVLQIILKRSMQDSTELVVACSHVLSTSLTPLKRLELTFPSPRMICGRSLMCQTTMTIHAFYTSLHRGRRIATRGLGIFRTLGVQSSFEASP